MLQGYSLACSGVMASSPLPDAVGSLDARSSSGVSASAIRHAGFRRFPAPAFSSRGLSAKVAFDSGIVDTEPLCSASMTPLRRENSQP